jgi:2-polyprenyl-3-methyl-5-hydroxy-6-metoxy-1,4-benzoquinol methylase
VTDQELAEAIEGARERARAQAFVEPRSSGDFAVDLMPLVHARDAAESKVAAIGTVNPRAGGLVNSLVQTGKRCIARALNWHVREQVEFNRASMECVQATLEAMTAMNRTLLDVTAALQTIDDLKQADHHRVEAEIRMLRTVSELQAAYAHRLTLQQENYRELLRSQHRDFETALARQSEEVQAKVRFEQERVIHNELRLLRQRASVAAPTAVAAAPVTMDWSAFAARFRGSEERIQAQQKRYVDRFKGTVGEILDIGCGRGEFLEAARASDLSARGLDLNPACVAECHAKGLTAECGDLFTYLHDLSDRSLAGVYCAQVVEHLTPAEVARLIQLLGQKLRSGALVAIETPNPECLAIFATHFYIDPTHTRPVPATLLRYYLEEAGCGALEVEYLEPAVDSLPELAELPVGVRQRFFGGLDYSIFARKL